MRKHAGLILAAMALSLGTAPAVFCGEPMTVYAATRLDAPDNTAGMMTMNASPSGMK